MSNERYRQAKAIFLAVCDLDPAERDAAIDEKCAGDAEMAHEVRSFLMHYSGGDGAGGDPTIVTPSAQSGDTFPEIEGYRVVRELGRGGMGVVYLATSQDEMLRRTVAVKIVKRGMDTDEVLRRFELERQLLAAMNHPGIARLYDAGRTSDGRPYFVMEFVEGMELLAYCDVQRLNINERLALFRKVCEAVHYAHQNLIVHRDLKPSNIIVGKDGQPKLLDFGIAKMLNPTMSPLAGAPTGPEFRVMTPQYASPEQVRGNPIGTASDVYALGVLLYEVVSGHSPYRLHSIVREELVRVICEVDPELPSTKISRIEESTTPADMDTGAGTGFSRVTPEDVARVRESRPERLKKRLSGDIDNIVLMAMKKEPQRRYPSAEQLGEDIRRHLEGMPVRARRDTPLYRARKFVGRNRTLVAMAAVLMLAITTGGVASYLGWTKAEQQKERADANAEAAETAFDDVRGFARLVMNDVHDEIQTLNGALPARKAIIGATQTYLTSLSDVVRSRPELESELADGYLRLGDILGGRRGATEGDPESAKDAYEKGLEHHTAALAAAPEDSIQIHKLSEAQMRMGDVERSLSNDAAAIEWYERSLDTQRRRAAIDGSAVAQRGLAIALLNVGSVLRQAGKEQDAFKAYEESVAIRRKLVSEDETNYQRKRDLSVGLQRLAGIRAARGETQRALDTYREAEGLRAALVDFDRENTRWQRDLATSRYLVASTLAAMGRPAEGLGPMRQAVEGYAEYLEANPSDGRAARDLGAGHALEAELLLAAGQPDKAQGAAERAVDVLESLVAAQPANADYTYNLARSRLSLGAIERDRGNLADAIVALQTGIAELSDALSTESAVVRRIDLAQMRLTYARWTLEAGSPTLAVAEAVKAARALEALARADQTGGAAASAQTARAVEARARIAVSAENPRSAAEQRADAEKLITGVLTSPDAGIEALCEVAEAYHDLGQTDDAVRTLRRAVGIARPGPEQETVEARIAELEGGPS